MIWPKSESKYHLCAFKKNCKTLSIKKHCEFLGVQSQEHLHVFFRMIIDFWYSKEPFEVVIRKLRLQSTVRIFQVVILGGGPGRRRIYSSFFPVYHATQRGNKCMTTWKHPTVTTVEIVFTKQYPNMEVFSLRFPWSKPTSLWRNLWNRNLIFKS